ncbi:uncharacterized protein N7483_008064 [Penicillium malachiteum]|uniref:uncharacterized protein n=1 Tax=Penicillium malachiteum TaxID=1324776 RepID=UPI0025487483|nr:uncharacterized protein N7483_008064 [Penicillium malachiteum]KAJ5726707.1 hypothetical protein N7483_008064 [Penicillium malachiteum]
MTHWQVTQGGSSDSSTDEESSAKKSKTLTRKELEEKGLDEWKPLTPTFEEDVRQFWARLSTGTSAWPLIRPVEAFERQRAHAQAWAQSWRRDEGPDSLSHLTKKQKRAIMHKLQHCCIETDFDTLMERLPLFMQLNVSGMLLECLLWTEAVNTFATHEFQYLDGKISSDDTEGDRTFHLRLEHIYKRFYETNPTLAAVWRADFHRLSLPYDRTQSRDLSLGKYHRARRDELIESTVDRFLSDELILALMGPVSEELVPDRREELQLAFYIIEDWMFGKLYSSTGHIEYKWLKDLPRTFSVKEKMTAHQLHFLHGKDNTRLDGHEIIMVTCPSPVIKWLMGKNGRLMDLPVAPQVLVMDDGKNKLVYKNNTLMWDPEE